MTQLLLLPGDGIGPEIVAATRTVLKAANERFDLGLVFEKADIGFDALRTDGTTMPDAVLARAFEVDGVVLGPVSHNAYPPPTEGGANPSAILRTQLDLYANVRPARTRDAFPAPSRHPFDIVIYRENTEGFYADRNMASGPGEFRPVPDVALAMRKVTRHASARIAEAAFAAAAARPKKHVTAVHKASVLKLSDGLFLEETRRVAGKYPNVTYDEVLVDAMAAHLVREPGRFDVVVTTNMFGDILSDLASELSGSLGLAAALNMSETRAMAQAQHGSAPDIAGRDIANPAALIGSAALLLEWIARRQDAERFRRAAREMSEHLETALADPAIRTPDLGGHGTTSGMAASIAEAISGDSE